MPRTSSVNLRIRLLMLLIGWGTVGLCYTAGRLTPRTAYVLHENRFDQLVPFNAAAVWIYLSFFLFIPAVYLCAAPERLKPLTQAMQLCAVLAGIVFIIWPTTIVYPAIPATVNGTAWRLLASFDSPQNCLPSLHGALTLLGIIALWQKKRPWRSAFFTLWGLAVMWSVVQTRRHLSIDLGAGVLLGTACAGFIACRCAVLAAHTTSPSFTSEIHS